MFGGEDDYAPAALPAPIISYAEDGEIPLGGNIEPEQAFLGIYGSVGVLPLMRILGEAFREESGFEVEVVAGGKEDAIEAVDNREASVAVYDEARVSEVDGARVIAIDGVKLIVNPSLDTDDIGFDLITDLFTDMDFMIGDDEVTLLIGAPETHSRRMFEEIFPVRDESEGMLVSLVPVQAAVFDDDCDIVEAVLDDPLAVGVISIGTDARGAKTLSVDSYLPEDEPYCAIRQVALYSNPPMNEAEKAFASFIESGALNRVLTDNGYVSVK